MTRTDIPEAGSTAFDSRPDNEKPAGNPYVGPRTFSTDPAEAKRFFGRDREARDLLSLAISQKLVLFYAQSGAGKSSLINTRLIPGLQREGFEVLPVGRVGGELPEGVTQVENIFLYNLMLSLDRGRDGRGGDPHKLVGLKLGEFLERLTSDDGTIWYYDDSAPAGDEINQAAGAAYAEPNYVLIVDQFEEIITTYPDRWEERRVFFSELDAAMRADPKLWVVLTLREDHLAALDPFAALMTDHLRARFYMERMGIEAALEAVARPAALYGRPFEPAAAEELVDQLRQIRVPSQEDTVSGQYVEPVQLQVVCYQVWEAIKGLPLGPITSKDLVEAGDIERALRGYYKQVLDEVVANPESGVTEPQLRTWFEEKLITKAGTRGFVLQTDADTGELPNRAVKLLEQKFLIRRETRAGGVWYELVHDTFVGPIRRSNQQWRLEQSVAEVRRFDVHPRVVSQGVDVEVEWEVEHADHVQLDPIGLVLDGLAGAAKVRLERSTSLRLSAQRQGQASVSSQPLPVAVVEGRRAPRLRQMALAARGGRLTVLIGREIDRRLLFGGMDTMSEAWTAGVLTDDPLALRNWYLGFVKDLLVRHAPPDRSPRLERSPMVLSTMESVSVSEIAAELGYLDPERSAILDRLAGLRTSMYVTSSPYTLLEESLRRMNRQPFVEVCRWHPGLDGLPSVFETDREYVPTVESPLVFHLYGLDKFPESLVLTEDDYVAFLIQVREDRDRIPIAVRYAIHRSFDLLLGYDAQSWDFKALYHGVIASSLDRRVGGVLQIEVAAERSQAQIDLQEANVRRAGLDVFWGDPQSALAFVDMEAREIL